MQSTLIEYFSILPDPRRLNHHGKRHELIDVIVITILAVISGADNWTQMESFGNAREEWLQQFLTLPNGIPSADTFARIFSILNPDSFQACFTKWVKSVRKITKGEVIAVDGKTVRRAHRKGGKPPHIISAFATANGVTLGQIQVDDKTNEITEIPKLLDTLMLKGCIVTTDAMGCQTAIAEKIVENKGYYLLAVKGNQRKVHNDLISLFNELEEKKSGKFDYARTEARAHGRNEIRECWTTTDLSSVRDIHRWKKLTTVVCVTDTRTVNGKTTEATRYFISNLDTKASEMLSAVRAHWAVENTLHWSLDVVFREDESRIRTRYAQQNLSLVRKFALTMLRNEQSTKDSVKTKRFRATLDPDYLLDVLHSMS
jgi:predicted transposase YbfD/YdcC